MLALQPVQRQRMALPCISFATQKKQCCYALPLTAARRQRCRLDVIGVTARGLRPRLRLGVLVGVERPVQAVLVVALGLVEVAVVVVGHARAMPSTRRRKRKNLR